MSARTTSLCQCGATLDWLDFYIQNSCDEPCRFAMGKSGEGKPPIPTEDFIRGYREGMLEEKGEAGERIEYYRLRAKYGYGDELC